MTAEATASPFVKRRECWFETNLESVRASVIRGRPDRIFSSTDPRWEKIEASKVPLTGSLVVGTLIRDGENIMEGSLRVEELQQMLWHRARELMTKFEKDQRTFDTPLADQIREHEKAREDGQTALANGIVSGILQGFGQIAAQQNAVAAKPAEKPAETKGSVK